MATGKVYCYRELKDVPIKELLQDSKGNLIHKPAHGSAHWVSTGDDIGPRTIPKPLTRTVPKILKNKPLEQKKTRPANKTSKQKKD
jgi:hypothetical protein